MKTLPQNGPLRKLLTLLVTTPNGKTLDEVATALHKKNEHASSFLYSAKKAGYIDQSAPRTPYKITKKGMQAVGATATVHSSLTKTKQVNGHSPKRFAKPSTMTDALFSELCAQYDDAEKRADAIEQLFQTWPR